jgi:hypothetical protein
VEEKKKEEKQGFFAKLFKRSETVKQPVVQQKSNEIKSISGKPIKKIKRYFALQAIYGGELEPFPH